jgi:glycosyltransferase involved in cell wall biosynthesis
MSADTRSAILVTTHPGDPSCAEYARLAVLDQRPRKDYVELARRLDADVLDCRYMTTRASPLARLVARRAGMPAGQIVEAFVRRNRYAHLCAWADRLGLPLAALFKAAGVREDLVLISVRLSNGGKAALLKHLRVHSHLRAIVNYGSVQMGLAATALGVPAAKLALALQPVDERFWRPQHAPLTDAICAVGWEARDYPTLIEAMRGLHLRLDLAVGGVALAPSAATRGPVATRMQQLARRGLPDNVKMDSFTPAELRTLYGHARFVVVPLADVDYDAGVNVIVEAMAMGKAVIVTRTRGQVDLVRNGEQGIYVPPGDPAALRAAITFLADHPEEAARMGRAGRALVEQRHTLDAYIGRLASIIEPHATPRDAASAGSARRTRPTSLTQASA